MKQQIAFFNWLQLRLSKPLPGFDKQRLMMPQSREIPSEMSPNMRKSAVLLLIYPENKDFKLVLIQRSLDGGAHSGQIAFPGGKVEEFDVSLEATALREAQEEVFLESKIVKIIGRLTPMFIPVSNFQVVPVVAYCNACPILKPCPDEVADILHFSFLNHFDKKVRNAVFASEISNVKIKAPAYKVRKENLIWGATAMILSELESLWEEYNFEIK